MKGLKINRGYLAFLGLLLLSVFYPKDKPAHPSPLETDKQDSDYYMKGVVIHLYDKDGQQLSQLKSVKLAHFKHQDQSLLEAPVIRLNQADGSLWQLQADKGKIIKHKNQIELIDQVVVKEILQQKISTQIDTQYLLIDLEKTTATTDDPITISHQYYQTRSIGMDVDFKQNIINLNHEVVTEKTP